MTKLTMLRTGTLTALKFAPVLVIAAGTLAILDGLSPLRDYSKIVAVQGEINYVAAEIAISGEIPNEDEFGTYLKSRYQPVPVRGLPSRTTSAQDYWFDDYRLFSHAKNFRVVSAGPDRVIGTRDDLYADGAI